MSRPPVRKLACSPVPESTHVALARVHWRPLDLMEEQTR